jgi:hypothetical protein
LKHVHRSPCVHVTRTTQSCRLRIVLNWRVI